MLPAPLWLALVRAMLVVDDGTRITQLSLHGEGKEEAAWPQKGSQPRLAALGSPFQRKGLGWTLPPSYGRRCPEGAEGGWGKRYEKRSGKIVSSTPLTKAPERRWRGPPSPMGKATIRGYRFSRHNAFPKGEGKEEAAWPQKGSQPRLAALGSPFQGKGLAWTLPPSYGRRCPEGAEVGWGKRYPRHKAFPAWGRWRAKRAG